MLIRPLEDLPRRIEPRRIAVRVKQKAVPAIRETVENHEFPEVKHLTVSMGVTSADPNADYQETFIQADRALYMAKTGGRNRVIGLF